MLLSLARLALLGSLQATHFIRPIALANENGPLHAVLPAELYATALRNESRCRMVPCTTLDAYLVESITFYIDMQLYMLVSDALTAHNQLLIPFDRLSYDQESINVALPASVYKIESIHNNLCLVSKSPSEGQDGRFVCVFAQYPGVIPSGRF